MPAIIASTRRQFLWTLGAGFGFLAARDAWGADSGTPLQSFARSDRALGSEVSLTVLSSSRLIAERALSAGFTALERVEAVMSLYRPESELSRLNRDGLLRDPAPELVEILRHARAISLATRGAFDVTVQPLWTLYAISEMAGRAPAADEIAAACAQVDWRQVAVDTGEIRLGKPGMAITLNGIAQGYAADCVRQALTDAGIEHALINTGEIGGVGRRADAPWRVGIQHPADPEAYIALIELDDRCLATSGRYATRFDKAGAHHIFDPRTGRSPHEVVSVSVLARTAWEADALSTSACVLGADAGSRLIAARPGADAFFVLDNGRTLATPGFPLIANN